MFKPSRPLQPIRRLLTLMLWVDAAVILSVVFRLDGPSTGRFEVLPSVVYGPQPQALQQDNPQLHIETVGVSLPEPTLWQTVLDAFSHGLPFALATVPMLIMARRLVDRAVASHPFTEEAARGVRRLGVVVLVAGASAEAVRALAAYLLFAGAAPGAFHLATPVGFWWLFAGLLLLGFAQVLNHGRTLRAELDEVV